MLTDRQMKLRKVYLAVETFRRSASGQLTVEQDYLCPTDPPGHIAYRRETLLVWGLPNGPRVRVPMAGGQGYTWTVPEGWGRYL
jgi:hypothetical protein